MGKMDVEDGMAARALYMLDLKGGKAAFLGVALAHHQHSSWTGYAAPPERHSKLYFNG